VKANNRFRTVDAMCAKCGAWLLIESLSKNLKPTPQTRTEVELECPTCHAKFKVRARKGATVTVSLAQPAE